MKRTVSRLTSSRPSHSPLDVVPPRGNLDPARVRSAWPWSAALLVLSVACAPSPEQIANGEDPLRALEVSVASTKYNSAYWGEESHNATLLWTEALEKCSDAKWSTTPNCVVVRE